MGSRGEPDLGLCGSGSIRSDFLASLESRYTLPRDKRRMFYAVRSERYCGESTRTAATSTAKYSHQQQGDQDRAVSPIGQGRSYFAQCIWTA